MRGFIMSEKKFLPVLKGVVAALCAAFAGLLIFAVVLTIVDLPSSTVKAVNQFIKVIAIFCGCFFTVKEKGAVKGAVIGLTFTVLIYLIFALINASGLNGKAFWSDAAFGLIAGVISGIISANVRGERL